MKRSGLRLAGRLVLPALLVGAILWVWMLHRDTEPQPDDPYAPPFAALDDVSRFVFRSGRDSIVVEQVNGGYWITYPIRDRADAHFTAELLRYVRTVSPARVLADSLDVDAGLSPARSVVRLTVPDGRSWSIEVGDTSPIGSQVYARITPGRPGTLLFDHFSARRFLTPALNVIRDKTAAPVLPGPVDSVEVRVVGLSLHARRVRRDLWEAVVPHGVQLHAPSLNVSIQELRAPVIQGFPEPGSDPRDLGLDPPRAVWVIHQRAIAESVAIGNRTPDGRSLYILPSGRSEPAMLDAELEVRLTGGWPSLADRSLLETQSDDWTAVRFLGMPDSLGYGMEDGRWTVLPAGVPLSSQGQLTRDLGNLAQLRWREFPWPPDDPPPAQQRISLELRSGTRAETLELAAPVDSTGWARSSSRPRWGRVSPHTFRTWIHRAGNPDS